jgi:hypothetical protein
VRAIWRLELARARHVLRAYLRTRLYKLERYVTAVLDNPQMQARLSPRELQYATVGCPTSCSACQRLFAHASFPVGPGHARC